MIPNSLLFLFLICRFFVVVVSPIVLSLVICHRRASICSFFSSFLICQFFTGVNSVFLICLFFVYLSFLICSFFMVVYLSFLKCPFFTVVYLSNLSALHGRPFVIFNLSVLRVRLSICHFSHLSLSSSFLCSFVCLS